MEGSIHEHLQNTQQKALIQGMSYLYNEEILWDTILEAENEQVKVHKCVLAALSPYFRAMFSFEAGNPEKVIRLGNMTGAVLCDVVKFLYTGHISVDDNNIQALSSAANMLQIEPLLNFCVDYMSNALCVENCLEVFMFADFLSLPSLKATVESFVLEHFSSIYQSDQFCLLECSTLSGLLKSDDLNVSDETAVYEAVILWINHDPEERKNNLPLLLLSVRLPLMTSDYIRNVVCREDLIVNNALCSHLVSQTLASFEEGKLTDSESFSSVPRIGMFEKEMLVFSGGAYSFEERAFSCVDLNTYEGHHSIEPHSSFDFKYKLDLYKLLVTPKNEIFCIGGIFYHDYHFQRDGAEALKAVMQYDQRSKVWKQMPSMPAGRCGFASCSHDRSLYVFGGYQFYPGHAPTDQTFVFDIDLETWRHCQTMPLKMAFQAVASVQNRAFLFGGKDDASECLPLVLQYLYTADQWSVVDTNIPRPMSEATAITIGGLIYLLGGSNRNGYVVSVMSFEPDKLRWGFCEDFPEHRKILCAVGARNHIYVFGGLKHLQLLPGGHRGGRTVECKDLYRYSIDRNVWTKESRNVKYGNCYVCCLASINVKFLTAVNTPLT